MNTHARSSFFVILTYLSDTHDSFKHVKMLLSVRARLSLSGTEVIKTVFLILNSTEHEI